jgi:hypothetical protein
MSIQVQIYPWMFAAGSLKFCFRLSILGKLSGFSENLHPTLRLVPDDGCDGRGLDRRPGPTAGGGGGGGPAAAQAAGTFAPAGQRLRSPGSTGVQPVCKQRGKPKYCTSGTITEMMRFTGGAGTGRGITTKFKRSEI